MRLVRGIVIAGVLAAVVAAPALCAEINLNTYPLAVRGLNADDWDPIEHQVGFGNTVDLGEPGWPIHMAFGLHASIGADDTKSLNVDNIVGSVGEMSFGLTKVWVTKGGTSITIFGVQGDADYWQFGPMIGWSWPGK